jgi:integrase
MLQKRNAPSKQFAGVEQRHGNQCPLPIDERFVGLSGADRRSLHATLPANERARIDTQGLILGKKDCGCPWRASVFSKRDGKKIRKTFPTQAEAKAWREDESYAVRKKMRRAPTPTTLAEAAEAWFAGAERGEILTRGEIPYKPAAIRSYRSAWELRIKGELGDARLSELERADLQTFVNKLKATKLHASTVSGTFDVLRVIYRRALEVSEVHVNPTTGVKVPAVVSGERRIVPPQNAMRLLAVLPADDRAIWATGMFAGLRRGELQALRAENVQLGASVIWVEYGWDPIEGEIPTKNRGKRRVPIPMVLRDYLDERLANLPWRDQPDGLVFGREPRRPFPPVPLAQRAGRAWKAAGLEGVSMHETRHTYASFMIGAMVEAGRPDIKALSSYMGHSKVGITQDLYGHLLPGGESEHAGFLDAFIARADTAARAAQLDETQTSS